MLRLRSRRGSRGSFLFRRRFLPKRRIGRRRVVRRPRRRIRARGRRDGRRRRRRRLRAFPRRGVFLRGGESRARSVRAVLGLPDDSPERAGVSSSAAPAARSSPSTTNSRRTRREPRGEAQVQRRRGERRRTTPSTVRTRLRTGPLPRPLPRLRTRPLPAPHPLSDRISSAPVTPVRAFDECLAGAPGPVATARDSATPLSKPLSRRSSPPLSRLASHLPRRPGRRTCRFRRRV